MTPDVRVSFALSGATSALGFRLRVEPYPEKIRAHRPRTIARCPTEKTIIPAFQTRKNRRKSSAKEDRRSSREFENRL
jgi:hypothetical protein